jgi:cytochrome P450
VRSDDLLLESAELAPWRPAVGIAPKLTDAELITLAVIQALLGFTSERRFIRHASTHLRHLFPYLPKAPGYNKRLRKAAGMIQQVIRLLAADTTLWGDDVWVVDSTPVECGRSRETVKRSDLAGWAEYG